MNGQDSNHQIDTLLLPFLQATNEEEAELHLDRLIAHIAPIIRGITKRSRDSEDAFQETIRLVINQLREFKSYPDGKAISNYLHYVKTIASHVVKGQLREENPQRRSLIDSLRYVLKNKKQFAMWVNENKEKFCGLAAWRHQQSSFTRSDRLIRLLNCPQIFEEVVLGQDVQSLDNAQLLAEIFNWVGHPVRFDELVRIICDLKRLQDPAPVAGAYESESLSLNSILPDIGPLPDEVAQWSEFLSRLWIEIEQMPRLQRIAYLLNFTAANGQVELFLTYGVATIRRIGSVLELTEEQFSLVWPELQLSDETRHYAEALTSYDERFALLWQHLPLTDATIARMLGTQRQKVINLRKAAGDRLSRRLIHLDGAV